jgi:hypothetical protein
LFSSVKSASSEKTLGRDSDYRKQIIKAIDQEITRAIDTDHTAALTAELIRDRVDKLRFSDRLLPNEFLDLIISKTMENADILLQIRRLLQEQVFFEAQPRR